MISTFHSSYCTSNIINTGVGPLNANETEYAKALDDSLVIYYNVPIEKSSSDIDSEESQDNSTEMNILSEPVIYHLVDRFIESVQNSLPKIPVLISVGEATVRQVFSASKEIIAGCKVNKGVMNKKLIFRVKREGNVLREEESVKSMKQQKNDVSLVESGRECGIVFESFSDVQVGDLIECLETEMQTPDIEWDPDF